LLILTTMLSFLRASGPPRTRTADHDTIVLEGGRSWCRFAAPGSDYIMTQRIPPTTKENGPSILQPPFHYHLYQDEYFRIQSGKGNFYTGLGPSPAVVLSPDGTTTTSIKAGTFHRFENASTTEDLVLDIKLTPETYEQEQKFFRNFFSYLDDCTKTGAPPSTFQLLVFLHEADTPLVIPVPVEGLGRALSRILLSGGAAWGRYVLGYQPSYEEYYHDKKSL
jgi:mannose-6-phosphate isomerase-like protein (cupin superfamily)